MMDLSKYKPEWELAVMDTDTGTRNAKLSK